MWGSGGCFNIKLRLILDCVPLAQVGAVDGPAPAGLAPTAPCAPVRLEVPLRPPPPEREGLFRVSTSTGSSVLLSDDFATAFIFECGHPELSRIILFTSVFTFDALTLHIFRRYLIIDISNI